jgi:hypothetical protein
MRKTYSLTLSLVIVSIISSGQNIDSLKLTDSEMPKDYSKSDKLICKTIHAQSFYEQSDIYSSMFGSIVKKDFQSFEKKGDKGSILYFEFEKDFTGGSFLKGLLWGEADKPSKKEPDEYFIKGKFLVIWSFSLDSEIKKNSKDKVIKLLQ